MTKPMSAEELAFVLHERGHLNTLGVPDLIRLVRERDDAIRAEAVAGERERLQEPTNRTAHAMRKNFEHEWGRWFTRFNKAEPTGKQAELCLHSPIDGLVDPSVVASFATYEKAEAAMVERRWAASYKAMLAAAIRGTPVTEETKG